MALNATVGRKGGAIANTHVTATVIADKSEAGIKLTTSKLKVVAEGLTGHREVAVRGGGEGGGREVPDLERAPRQPADRARGEAR